MWEERREELVKRLVDCHNAAGERASKARERGEDAKADKWRNVQYLFSEMLDLLEGSSIIARTSAISVDNPAQVSWAEREEDWHDNARRKRASFAVWAKKLYTAEGRQSPDAVMEAASVWGDVSIARSSQYVVKTHSGEDLLRMYEEFNHIDGLSSCMTKTYAQEYLEVYAFNPGVVRLAVAYRGDRPMARALLWVEAYTGDDEKIVFLDRVYATEEGARDFLKRWALGNGYFVRTRDSYSDLEDDGGAINADGKTIYRICAPIKWSLNKPWPYMDTLKYLEDTGHGTVWACSWEDEGTVARATQIDGTIEWFNRLVCVGCEAVLDEDEAHFYDGEPYCEGCFDDRFGSCVHCGENYPYDDLTYLEEADGGVCDGCIHWYYALCDVCNEYRHRDRMSYLRHLSMGVCDACLEDFAECEACHRLFPGGDLNEDGLCEECAQEVRDDENASGEDEEYPVEA